MSAWDNLSIREKAAMMRTAVSNGITNIDDIRREYNEFAEGGPKKWTMEDEAGYREWRNSLPDNLKYTDDNIYDMIGAYQAGMQPTLEDDGKYHLGSRDPQTGKILKAPYHPTYLQALNEDARMGYYPTLTTDGTYTDTWKGNISKEIQVPYRPYAKGGNLFDTGGPKQNFFVEVPSSTYVSKPLPLGILINGNSPESALKRTNRVYSNYSEAKDNPLTPLQEVSRNTLRWFQDRGLNPFGSGISNCTLTATQWVDPNNPIKNASSIYNSPELYNYTQIDEKDAIPGDIVIAKDPNRESYHTMLINGFAKEDGVYNFNGNDFSYKKGEPLMTYSRGGHDASFIRRDVPLSVYTANGDGHTSNTFYRYNYPNSVTLPEVVITPKALGGNLFDTGGPQNPPIKTTGGAGYVPSIINTENIKNIIKKNVYDYITGGLPIDTVRSRIYNNLFPGYDGRILKIKENLNRVRDAVVNNKAEVRNTKNTMLQTDEQRRQYMDDLLAEYLQIPHDKRRSFSKRNYLEDSPYKPNKSKNSTTNYKRITSGYNRRLPGLSYSDEERLIKEAMGYKRSSLTYDPTSKDPEKIGDYKLNPATYNPLNINESTTSRVLSNLGLGTHTISRGYDNKKGEYISYYDLWDMAPTKKNGGGDRDESLGIGKPVEIYDRVYLDDHYEVPDQYKGGFYLPELEITKGKKSLGGNLYPEGGPKNEYEEISSTVDGKPMIGNTRKVKKAPVDITPIDLATMYANNVRNGNKMIDTLMLRKIDNYMISKNVGLPQRQSLSYTIQQEGNTTKPHGNGAYGLVGWRGERAKNLPITLAGQMEKLYNEVFGNFNADNWHHGGTGSGYMTGREAQNAFINAKTIEEAIKALNYGYVRPPLKDRIYRTQTSGRVFKKEKSLGGNLYPKGGSLNPNVDRAMKYFMDKGFTDYQAAGLVGNLMRESSMNPNAVNKSSGAYGLLQWLGPRKKNLFKMYGEHPTFDQQLDYLWHELNTTHKKGLKLILASPDAKTSAGNTYGNVAFLGGIDAAIKEMNKYGQDGEGALRKGVDFAMNIMGQNPVEYVPQKQLPTNFGLPQNWENPVQIPTVSPNASRPVMMPQPFYTKDETEMAYATPVKEPSFLERYDNLRRILSLFGVDI